MLLVLLTTRFRNNRQIFVGIGGDGRIRVVDVYLDLVSLDTHRKFRFELGSFLQPVRYLLNATREIKIELLKVTSPSSSPFKSYFITLALAVDKIALFVVSGLRRDTLC